MISNMFALVEAYGFVPNGGRVYYLNRSQPPMLTQMCVVYFEYLMAEGEEEAAMAFLSSALPILEEEHTFWMDTHVAEVTVEGKNYTLNRYNAHCSFPRPEGYAEDVETATEAGVQQPLEPNQLYVDLASGAETGWDYSSRWFADHVSLTTIEASSLLPVDLNAILFRNELAISRMYGAFTATDERSPLHSSSPSLNGESERESERVGESEKERESERDRESEKERESESERERAPFFWEERERRQPISRAVAEMKENEFLEFASERKAAIEAVLWNDEVGLWLDYDLVSDSQRDSSFFYPSVFAPLWAELYWNNETAGVGQLSPRYVTDRFLGAIDQFGALQFPGGAPASLVETGQQWDFPNGWAPLQA